MKKSGISKRIAAGAMAAMMLFGSAALTADAASFTFGNKSTNIEINIPVNGSGITLDLNRTYDIPALVSGLTGNSYKVTLSNSRVAKYSGGKLSTTGVGDVKLTITTKKGVTLSKTITVKKPSVEISLSSSRLSMIKGQSKVLSAIVKNSKASVKWSSSNNRVVSIDQNGKLRAVKAGTAVITASTSSGKKATCTVTVGDPVNVTKVAFKHTGVKLKVGQTYQQSATVYPSNATYKSVGYKSSNTKVATVSPSGKITAKGVGECKITATGANGKTAVCTVYVQKK